jgi:hypothetical protein
MGRYRVRIQIIEWYEVAVSATSPGDAIDKAESMRPAQIRLIGKRWKRHTGLADFHSVEIVDEPSRSRT